MIEKFIKVSVNEYGNNPSYCVSLPGYTWQCGLKYTGINLQTLQDYDLFLILENNIRGGISSIKGDRYVKSDDIKKIKYMDATNLYGHSMIQPLLYDEIEMWHGYPDLYMNNLQECLKSPGDSDIGYFIRVDLKYSNNINEKTKNFAYCPENKFIRKNKYNDFTNKMKPKNYTKAKKKYVIGLINQIIWFIRGC